MLLDLHVHTMVRSLDSGLSIDALMTAARRRGLDGVCLTEHNNVWPPHEVTDIQEKYGLIVLRGLEVSVEGGYHVLVFGVDDFALEMMRLEQLRRIVNHEGGVMALAHPSRYSRPPLAWSDLLQVFDAVEVRNGSDGDAAGDLLAAMAFDMGVPGIAGSDAHNVGPIGTCATEFFSPVQDEADLIRQLKAGTFQPVRLGDYQPPKL